MKNKAIIHIGASELQIESIKWAKELDLYVIVTDKNKNAVGIKFADEYYCISGDNEDELVALALKKNKEFDIVGAYGNSDFALLSISKIHKALKIKGPDYDSVKLSLDKFSSKEIWIDSKISTPIAIKIKNINELDMENINYPIIIKPKDSCGSQGIKSVNNEKELTFAIEEAFHYSNEVLIENLIDGKHYDTIGVMWDNKFIPMGISNRYFTERPYHISIWGHAPTDLLKEEIDKAYRLTSNAAKALNLNFTPVKADLIYCDGKFYIIEITPRFHGDVITAKTIPFTGSDIPIQTYYKLLLGNTVDFSLKIKNRIIWKALFPIGVTSLDFSNIEYKDVVIVKKEIETITHKDNTSLVGFIWFQVPDDVTFKTYYQNTTKQLATFI